MILFKIIHKKTKFLGSFDCNYLQNPKYADNKYKNSFLTFMYSEALQYMCVVCSVYRWM